MTDVSESAGVSRGTLYRYFPTRARLLAGLVQHEMRRFRASMLGATRDSLTVVQHIFHGDWQGVGIT